MTTGRAGAYTLSAMNGIHDLGGSQGHGAVVVEPGEPVFHAEWEGRVRGMFANLLRAGVFNLDEFRHAQERLPQADYLTTSYYARWLAAIQLLLQEKGLSHDGAPRADVDSVPETRSETDFAPGDRVVTRNMQPPGHTRLPRYARAKHGVVESVRGPFLLPDTNAQRRSRDWEPVYTVVFPVRELWGAAAGARDTVSLDLWQSYLEEDTVE
jgi:nitrile hydratase subunit beta